VDVDLDRRKGGASKRDRVAKIFMGGRKHVRSRKDNSKKGGEGTTRGAETRQGVRGRFERGLGLLDQVARR